MYNAIKWSGVQLSDGGDKKNGSSNSVYASLASTPTACCGCPVVVREGAHTRALCDSRCHRRKAAEEMRWPEAVFRWRRCSSFSCRLSATKLHHVSLVMTTGSNLFHRVACSSSLPLLPSSLSASHRYARSTRGKRRRRFSRSHHCPTIEAKKKK